MTAPRSLGMKLLLAAIDVAGVLVPVGIVVLVLWAAQP